MLTARFAVQFFRRRGSGRVDVFVSTPGDEAYAEGLRLDLFRDGYQTAIVRVDEYGRMIGHDGAPFTPAATPAELPQTHMVPSSRGVCAEFTTKVDDPCKACGNPQAKHRLDPAGFAVTAGFPPREPLPSKSEIRRKRGKRGPGKRK